MMRNRSRTDIVTMILEAARTGATKTKIMYKAYLSYGQLVEYIKHLQQNDLLIFEADTQLYRPTEKGLKFLDLLNVLGKIVPLSNSENYKMES